MPAKVDLTGHRFGRLVAIRPTDKRDGSNIIWECRCDCGGTRLASVRHLKGGAVQSCGCIHAENLTKTPREVKLGQIENTNLSRIRSKARQRNNTSGVRGVSFDKKSKRWAAYIYFQRRRYHLGYFDTLEGAAKARKAAEGHTHDDFVLWHQSNAPAGQ